MIPILRPPGLFPPAGPAVPGSPSTPHLVAIPEVDGRITQLRPDLRNKGLAPRFILSIRPALRDFEAELVVVELPDDSSVADLML